MAKASPGQISFNTGLIDPSVDARIDVMKYHAGCSTLVNMLPLVEGPLIKRPGFEFKTFCIIEEDPVELLKFQFAIDDSFVLEFGNGYMRPLQLDSAVPILDSARPPLTITASTMSVGSYVRFSVADTSSLRTRDLVEIDNCPFPEFDGNVFPITVLNGTTFELKNVFGSTTIGSGGAGGTAAPVYSVVSPYTNDQVKELSYVQTADVLYIAHPDVHPQKLSRIANDDWVFADVPFAEPNISATSGDLNSLGSWPAFRSMNQEAIALYITNGAPLDVGDTVEIRAVDEDNNDVALFTAADVGRYIMLQDRVAQRGYGLVTAFDGGNPHLIDVEVYSQFPPGVGSPVWFDGTVYGNSDKTQQWAFSAFDDVGGYPKSVVMYENRIIWGGTPAQPNTFWATLSGGFENFREYGPDGVDAFAITPGSGFSYTINEGGQRNDIEWMSALDQFFIGTRAGEYTVQGGGALDEPITPANVLVRNRSNLGSRVDVDPLILDSFMLFVQRAGRKLYELVFDDGVKTFVTTDMNRLTRSVVYGRIRKMDFQHEPNRIAWIVLEDGSIVTFTYERGEGVTAWAELETRALSATDGIYESVAVIPAEADDADAVGVVATRMVTVDRKMIERLSNFWEQGQSFFASAYGDSCVLNVAVTTTGTTTGFVVGDLFNLASEDAIAVREDGSFTEATVGLDGVATFPGIDGEPAGSVFVNISMPAYDAKAKTMRFEAGAVDGISQGKTGRIHRLIIRLNETFGDVEYGPDFTSMDKLTLSSLTEGDTVSLPFPESSNQKREVAIRHSTPTPLTLNALFPQLHTQDRT